MALTDLTNAMSFKPLLQIFLLWVADFTWRLS